MSDTQLPDNRKSKQQIDEDLKKLDDLEPDDTDLDEDDDETEIIPKKEEKKEDNPDEEEGDEEEDEEEDPEKKKEDKDDPAKKRLDDSIKGANIEREKTKQFNESLRKASELNDVTDEEIKKSYPTYDDMTDTEKMLAKKAYISDRRFELINEGVKSTEAIDQWAEKVDTFTDDDDALKNFPKVEASKDEFKRFAMKPSRRGMDLEDIAASFSHNTVDAPKKKGSLLLKGGGGEKVVKSEMTPEDIRTLRVNKPREYQRLLKAGKIKIDID